MRAYWPSLLSIALLASCATGAGDEEDGVIRGRADARADGGAIEDDSATEEDTETESDTSVATDSGVEPSGDSGAAETYIADNGTADSGPADTGPADTGPTPCTGEEAEPNDTTATARTLGTIDDCDGSGKSVSGVLSSSSDVDVLTFDGTDSFGCSVNPTVTATGPVRVCIKATCKSGTTEFKSCPKGTQTGTECCGTTVELELNCTGTTSDDAKIAITVRGDGSSLTCAAYSLAYHY